MTIPALLTLGDMQPGDIAYTQFWADEYQHIAGMYGVDAAGVSLDFAARPEPVGSADTLVIRTDDGFVFVK